MYKNELFLDNAQFTNIVNAIEAKASDLVFDETPLSMKKEIVGTECMMTLFEGTESMIKLTKDYRPFVCDSLVPYMRKMQKSFNISADYVTKSLSLNCTCYSNQHNSSGNKSSVTPSVQMFMDQYGYTKEEAELIVKTIDLLNTYCECAFDNKYARIAFTYGVLSSLCINYDAKRWRLTTGQPFESVSIFYLRMLGLSEQEVTDLQVLLNLQHADFTYDKLREEGIDIDNSSFKDETYTKIKERAKDKNNDFAHSIVQIAALAHGDNMYEEHIIDLGRWAVDLFNSPINSNFSFSYTDFEISFKGDIDSGRYSESDFQSDIDAINIYHRMVENDDIGLDVFSEYYSDVENDSKQRAIEFFEIMGNGYADIGILNTAEVIEKETYGSEYIQQGNDTDVEKAKSIFIQWILSIYEGVDYEFPN